MIMQMDELKKLCHKVNAKEVLINNIKKNGGNISASIKERSKHWYYSEKTPLIYYTECSRELALLVSHLILNVGFTEKFIIEKMCVYNSIAEYNLDQVIKAEASITSCEINSNCKAKKATVKVDLYELKKVVATALIEFIYVSPNVYKKIRGRNVFENDNRSLTRVGKRIVIGDNLVNPSFTDHYQDHVPAMVVLELIIENIINNKPDKINSITMEFKRFLEKNIGITFKKIPSEGTNLQSYDIIQNENVCVKFSITCSNI